MYVLSVDFEFVIFCFIFLTSTSYIPSNGSIAQLLLLPAQVKIRATKTKDANAKKLKKSPEISAINPKSAGPMRTPILEVAATIEIPSAARTPFMLEANLNTSGTTMENPNPIMKNPVSVAQVKVVSTHAKPIKLTVKVIPNNFHDPKR